MSHSTIAFVHRVCQIRLRLSVYAHGYHRHRYHVHCYVVNHHLSQLIYIVHYKLQLRIPLLIEVIISTITATTNKQYNNSTTTVVDVNECVHTTAYMCRLYLITCIK